MAFSDFSSHRALAALDAWITREPEHHEYDDREFVTHCFLCSEELPESKASCMETETEGDVPVHPGCLEDHLAQLREEELKENMKCGK